MSSNFSWVPVHEKLALRLKEYRNRQPEMIQILKDVGIRIFSDKDKAGQSIELTELDPFSFFFFIYKHGEEKRLHFLRKVAEFFELPKPNDTDGVPSVTGQKTILFSFLSSGRTDEVARIWNLFEAAYTNSITNEMLADVISIRNTGKAKITEGLFIVLPDKYLPLNGQTKPYLKEVLGIDPEFKSYDEYVVVLNKIKQKDPRPFYQISHEAWAWNTTRDKSNYWIFQGNPKRYNFEQGFRKQLIDNWVVTSHRGKIQPGDKVILWIGGDDPGCYGLAEITSKPTKSEPAADDDLWRGEKPGAYSAGIRITHNLADNPIRKNVLLEIQELSGLKVGRQGTNFQATKDEFEIIKKMAERQKYQGGTTGTPGDSVNRTNGPLNTILYGPPGTGKTYSLIKNYFDQFTIRNLTKHIGEFEQEVIEELTWWEIVALVLLKEGNLSVPEIRNHKYIRIKEGISNNKNINAVIWGTLQVHAHQDFDNVKYAVRREPCIFRKLDNSVWTILKDECEQKTPGVLEILQKIKSYSSKTDEKRNYIFTTFHQSFTYEDFIEGIKPVLAEEIVEPEGINLSYTIQKGVFYKAVDEACKLAGFMGLKDCLEQKTEVRKDRFKLAPGFALFVDEINRGNISSIFGELITLIENDKRLTGENELIVHLPYSKKLFAVPPNLHIIGTMNTADRSVEALDTALRRRFSFVEVRPDAELIRTEGKLNGKGGVLRVGQTEFDLSKIMYVINQRIEKLIDKDHQIGHSYFMSVATEQDLVEIFRKNIIPLLEEYFYGDKGKMQLVLGKGFIEQKKNDVLFAESDDGITDLYEDRPVWNLLTEWHTDSGAFEKALNTLLRKKNG